VFLIIEFFSRFHFKTKIFQGENMKKLIMIGAVLLLATNIFAAGNREQVVIKGAADLDGKRIGVQQGTTGELFVQENVKNAKLSSFKSGIDAALDLKNGAIDAVILDELPAKEIVARNSDLMIISDKFAKEEYAIAVRKDDLELLNDINTTIIKLKSTGEYKKLVNAFMPTDGKIQVPASENIESSKILKLGTNATFPPFEYLEGKEIVGFDISVGERIAKDRNMQLEIVNMDFDSLIPALSSGAIDFIAAGMSVTEERKKNVSFSVPYFESEQVIIVRKPKQ